MGAAMSDQELRRATASQGLDMRCYVITSGVGRETIDAAAAAAAAGSGLIQVRPKPRERVLSTREVLDFSLAVARAVRAGNPATRVVVDDRADVAYAAELAEPGLVHGVHLGQDDLPVRAARALLGPDAIIGLTTGTLALVEQANEVADVIDYIGAGPFRLTPTKDSGRPPLGVEGYPPLVAVSKVPMVAIGDIGLADVAALAATGIDGVAVVRAVMGAPDPGAVTREILTAFDSARP